VILSDLLPDVLGRIEEPLPPSGPVFWSLTGEVYPQMVYGMFESALITGTVQLSNKAVTLTANTTYFSLQDGVLLPKGIVAPLRLRAAYQIRKTTLAGLDSMIPKWQQAAPSPQIIAWFPLGVSKFGIYPQLSADTQVTMDFIYSPVNEYRPYTGNETVPLQVEFTALLAKYGAAMLRTKEGGAEAEEADTVFSAYLEEVKELSLFQSKIDSVVYTTAFGGKTQVNPRTAI
jgi:hypothetical protein